MLKKIYITTKDLAENRQAKQKFDLKLPNNSMIPYLPDRVPQHVLMQIFTYLDRIDLIRLAGVCKYLRDLIFTSPQIWRTIRLKLSCRQYPMCNKSALWYAKLFGIHFKDLLIVCDHVRPHISCKTMTVCLRNILLSLGQTRLTSLVIREGRLVNATVPVVSSLVEILTRILTRCRDLQHFGMPCALWTVKDGSKVLDTLWSTSRGSLKSLRLDAYYVPPEDGRRPAEFDRVTTGILSLTHLTILGIDYCVLNDAFINSLSRANIKIKVLILFDLEVEGDWTQISKNAWVNLTQACPEMKVYFVTNGSTERIIPKLEPALKFYSIQMYVDVRASRTAPKVGEVLRHISTNFSRCLVRFDMEIHFDDRITTSLLHLVRHCQHLVHVKEATDLLEKVSKHGQQTGENKQGERFRFKTRRSHRTDELVVEQRWRQRGGAAITP
ncbi:uncharacterized protein LOC131939014 isoform X2 [Physella acuta]|uniref:uncharacterized protein LOC131939014 isoform X2 n=1 Tax=Physella acuta TaxID=109671 RepID=UPI0027DB5F7C|nr:uncharacterized protein LOC131939014 isoform X2 [Physella acuta]